MGFWIFMLIVCLLIPFSMIGFGRYFAQKAPKEINMLFGYRTSRSMKNMETWIFAHNYCGKLWRVMGWIMLIITLGSMMIVIGRDIGSVGTLGGVLCAMQCVFMLMSIVPVEIALRKNFDACGNPRQYARHPL